MKSIRQVRVFKRKVTLGVFMLGIRRILYQVILTSSNILLAKILAPDIFGAFAIISFLTLSLGILTNGGLSQALIQKKQDVSQDDMQTVLTTVLLTSIIFVVVFFFIAPLFDLLYQGKIGSEGIYWLRIFSFYILLANMYSLSMALIEKKLEYAKMTIGEIATLSVTQGSSIILAFLGWGIGSLVVGTLIGTGVGIVVLYSLNPWRIGISFSKKALMRIIGFGVNYQLGTLIAAANAAVIPGYVGIVSGTTAVGYITVMAGFRQVGLAPADTLSKLLFASSSQIQGDKKLLCLLVEKIIRFSSMTSLPLLGILYALAPQIISLVLSPRWLPALTTLYLSIFQGILLLLSTIFMQVLLGLGHVQFVRNTSLIWTIAQWILTPVFVAIWGYNGAVIAGILVSFLFFIPLKKLKTEIDIHIIPYFVPYIIYSVVLAIATYELAQIFIIDSLVKLIGVGCAAIVFYSAILILRERQQLLLDMKMIQKFLVSKNK